MAANDSRSDLLYFNKIVDHYTNIYHHSTNKKLLILIILLWLKKLKQTIKLLNLKLILKIELLSIKVFLVKFILKIGWENQNYYPEPDSDIRHKVKVVLNISRYATEKT